MAAESTFPTTVDVVPTQTVDNPQASVSINAVQALIAPTYQKQSVAYASEVAIEPSKGGQIVIGELTGTITIKNPPVAEKVIGRVFTLYFTQDATGHAATFGTEYKTVTTPVSATASKQSTVQLVWNGSKYIQVGGESGM